MSSVEMDGEFAVEDAYGVGGVPRAEDDLGGYGGIFGVSDGDGHGGTPFLCHYSRLQKYKKQDLTSKKVKLLISLFLGFSCIILAHKIQIVMPPKRENHAE